MHLGQTIAVETILKKKKSFFNLEIPFFCNCKQVIVAMVIVINTVITGVRLQQTVRLQLNRMISEE